MSHSQQTKKQDKKFWLSRFLTATCILLLTGLLLHHPGYFQQTLILGTLFVLLLLLTLLGGKWYSAFCRVAACVLCPITILCGVVILCWPNWGRYDSPEIDRSAIFSWGKVLLLVPHQDDELNLFGGLFEEFASRSDVYVLFSTNAINTRNRMDEGLEAMQLCGIPKDHVIFLGYGNNRFPSWRKGDHYQHIYNQGDTALCVTSNNHFRTWGTPDIPCFRPNRLYTRKNFLEDIKEAILQLKPDTLVCIDYDIHPDHRALSLLFEEALSAILRENPSYRPFILKSFCYSTSWFTPRDFYAPNLRSTPPPGGTSGHMPEVNYYQWKDRIRLPVGRASQTRLLGGHPLHEAFACYVSVRNVNGDAVERMPNGDKTFWWRPSGNLLLRATLTSNIPGRDELCDFKIVDSKDVSDMYRHPFDHGWFLNNGKGQVSFQLAEPSPIAEIWLYDHPGEENCVEHGWITLSNGKKIEIGALPADGAPLVVETKCTEALTGFTLDIDGATGLRPGLAEVEAYAEKPEAPLHVVKLQDHAEDFMYDYTVDPCGKVNFSLYIWPTTSSACYQVRLQSRGASGAKLTQKGKEYEVTLPPGREDIIQVIDERGAVVDAARISNPGHMLRWIRQTMQRMDPWMKWVTWPAQKHYYHRVYRCLFRFICAQMG